MVKYLTVSDNERTDQHMSDLFHTLHKAYVERCRIAPASLDFVSAVYASITVRFGPNSQRLHCIVSRRAMSEHNGSK